MAITTGGLVAALPKRAPSDGAGLRTGKRGVRQNSSGRFIFTGFGIISI